MKGKGLENFKGGISHRKQSIKGVYRKLTINCPWGGIIRILQSGGEGGSG